jgi:hypothetical protein
VADKFYEGLKALNSSKDSGQQLFSVDRSGTPDYLPRNPDDPLNAAFYMCPGLKPAMKRVLELRGGNLSANDALRIARLARRYSFNRY